jgi:hypothetical protein
VAALKWVGDAEGSCCWVREGGLVYLTYTFKYRSQFDEPNDDWLDAIEASSDELLGAYSRAEDDAMTTALGVEAKRD